MSADGSVTILLPFEEEIFAPGEGGFPGGVRRPATAITLCPLGGGVLAATEYSEETEYNMTQDGTALDLNSPRGGQLDYGFICAFEKEAISNSTLNGETYGVVSLGYCFQDNGTRELLDKLALSLST